MQLVARGQLDFRKPFFFLPLQAANTQVGRIHQLLHETKEIPTGILSSPSEPSRTLHLNKTSVLVTIRAQSLNMNKYDVNTFGMMYITCFVSRCVIEAIGY